MQKISLMKKQFATLMLVSLTLTSSIHSWAANPENPTDILKLSPGQAHKVSQLLIDGQVCKAKLDNTEQAYKICINDHHPAIEWWQEPQSIIAGGISISFVGFLLGLTHCFGSCK